MADELEVVRQGFVRQRRNLIGISLVLLLYERLGIVIETINIFGNIARISNPSSLLVLLWIAWIYFLVRYYQYFRDVGDKGFYHAAFEKLRGLVRPRAQKKFQRWLIQNKENLFPDAVSPLRIEFRRVDLVENFWRHWKLTMEVEVAFEANEQSQGNVHTSQSLKNREVDLFWSELIWPRIRSAWHVLINTRLVTEYVGPFAIGLLPALSWLTR